MYQKCMDGGYCEKTSCDDYRDSQKSNHPVVCVNWNQAKAYCQWAGGRLPTEAQWEKAARGTDERKYPWGDGLPTCAIANYYGKDNYKAACVGDTTEVGSYPSGVSPYGMLDMSGNVWEWVNDWYGENYYQSSPQKNPPGPGSGTFRVKRGGSWIYGSRFVRASYRGWYLPVIRNNYSGFRCVR